MCYMIGADIAEKEEIPDPRPLAHLLWSFSCFRSYNNRYFPSSKNLSVHMVLCLRGIIRIHKLHKCKASRFSVWGKKWSFILTLLEKHGQTQIVEYAD